MGVEGTPNKSQHRELTLEKKTFDSARINYDNTYEGYLLKRTLSFARKKGNSQSRQPLFFAGTKGDTFTCKTDSLLRRNEMK